MKKNFGFTLLETILVILLLGIIAATASKMMTTGFSAYLAGKNVTIGDWQGLIGIERMSRDFLGIRSLTTITPSNQITFTDTNADIITYSLSGTSLMRNTQILADGISSLTFNYYDENGVITSTLSAVRFIKMTLNINLSGANYTLTTSISPRNL